MTNAHQHYQQQPSPPRGGAPTIVIVLAVVVGVPLMMCGGCLGLGAIGSMLPDDESTESDGVAAVGSNQPNEPRKAEQPSEPESLASGEPESTASEGGDAKATALRILKDTETLLRQGKEMEPLRRSNATSDLSRCGQLMRERQAKAEALRDEAMKLPLRYRGQLAAPGNAILCVSCAKDAMDYCRMGEKSLREGRKALLE